MVTARYPTADRPGAGAFVRERLSDPAVEATVIAPERYDLPGWRRYASTTWQALTARGPFDGIEGHFLLPTGAIAVLAARLRRRRAVVFAHGTDVRVTARRSRLHRWLARWTAHGAAVVVANSAETASLVRDLGGEPLVIPPGVDLERFRPTPRPAERRVLFLGGTTAGKGLEVARGLADTLAGPGLDEVQPDALPALYAGHDVVLVPSAEEAFGLVAAEATASGRWVVARAVGGLRDIVEPGVTGTLVERDDEFADALRAVPDYDPDAVAARATRFDLRTRQAELRSAWERVLATGRRR